MAPVVRSHLMVASCDERGDVSCCSEARRRAPSRLEPRTKAKMRTQALELRVYESRLTISLEENSLLRQLEHAAAKKEGEKK